MKNNTLTYKVGLNKEAIDEHQKVLFGKEGVLTNHIPHIQTSLASIKTEVRILAVINIGAVILLKLLT